MQRFFHLYWVSILSCFFQKWTNITNTIPYKKPGMVYLMHDPLFDTINWFDIEILETTLRVQSKLNGGDIGNFMNCKYLEIQQNK